MLLKMRKCLQILAILSAFLVELECVSYTQQYSSSLGRAPVGFISRETANGEREVYSSLGNAPVGVFKKQTFPVPQKYIVPVLRPVYYPQPVYRPIYRPVYRPVYQPVYQPVYKPGYPAVTKTYLKPKPKVVTGGIKGRSGGLEGLGVGGLLGGMELGGLLGGLLGGGGGLLG